MVSPSSWALETMPRPAAEGDGRRIQHLGKLENFLARMDRAAADEDHGMLAGLDQRGRRFDAIWIGRRRGEGIIDLRLADFGALGEHVPRHLQRDRAAAAGQHFLEGAADHGRRDIRIFHPLGPTSRKCAASRAGPAYSCRWPRGPCPRIDVGNLASVGNSNGSLQPKAVSSAAPALSTPGPGTTLNTGPAGGARIDERHVAAGLLVARTDTP